MLKKLISVLSASVLGVCCTLGAMIADAPNNEASKASAYSSEETYMMTTTDLQLPTVRISGYDRYETAAQCVYQTKFNSGANNAILTSGTNWTGALVSVPLAKKLGAPILLTGKDTLNYSAEQALQQLNAKNVYIIGGKGTVSKSIEAKLNGSENGDEWWLPSYNVERIAGKNSFGHAVEVAKRLQELKKAKPRSVFIVSVSSFADTLSACTVAAIKESPILFVDKSGKLDDITKDYLKSCNKSISVAYVIGGPNAIAEKVVSELKPYIAQPKDSKTKTVIRLSGADRYETCVKVNRAFAKRFGNDICIATGKNFPDAIAGGAVAAALKAPMFLVGGKLTAQQKSYLKNRKTDKYYIFGGEAAVDQITEMESVFVTRPDANVSIGSKNYVIKWKRTPKVTGYKIYRDDKLIKTINDPKVTSFTDTKVGLGKDHYYKVRFMIGKQYYIEKYRSTADYTLWLNSVKLQPKDWFWEINTQNKKSTSRKVYLTKADKQTLKKFADKHFTKNMTNADKVVCTLRWLYENVEYQQFDNKEHQKKFNDMLKKNSWSYVNSAFNYKIGQCNVYNGAMVSMLTYLGYDAQVILSWRGYFDEKGKLSSYWQHYWGEVKIKGQTFLMETGNEDTYPGWYYICSRYEYSSGYTKNLKPC